MAEERTSVLIAEDQDIMRLGLKLTLDQIASVVVVGEAADGQEALDKAQELRPAVVLMDIDLPKLDGISATREVKESLPQTAVIIFTSDASDDSIFAALSAGADGYCLKNVSAGQLETAIRSVAQGAAWLDPNVARRVLKANARSNNRDVNEKFDGARKPAADALLSTQQVEVLELIEKGQDLQEVAEHLHVKPEEVEDKVRAILGRFFQTSVDLAAPGKKPQAGSLAPAASVVDDLLLSNKQKSQDGTFKSGTVLGTNYIIQEAVGTGGMSTVYRGTHKLMQRTVAIKVLHRHLLGKIVEVSRFHQEAKAASFLNHPNIITIYDFGITGEQQPYLVMDFIDGYSFQQLVAHEKVDLPRLVGIFIQICDALAHAHKRAIVHRDLKPSNIMVLKDDEGHDLVKLVDFGIAKLLMDNELRLTKSGDVCGTPVYMSPEQCKAEPMDARSDIYSLGCVMYEALAGKPPFLCNSAYETMSAHVNEPPSRLPFLAPDKKIPDELEGMIFKMLEKKPGARPQNVSEVRSVLAKLSLVKESL
jgi:DNA-binding NarL/FixJ family response regulator/tRNA A-37 threonylcarbamoyl transferase component Bud32